MQTLADLLGSRPEDTYLSRTGGTTSSGDRRPRSRRAKDASPLPLLLLSTGQVRGCWGDWWDWEEWGDWGKDR